MKKFTGDNFLELFFASLVLNDDYIISKKVVQENLVYSYLTSRYAKLFKNLDLKIDEEEAKRGNIIYLLDLEGCFENAVTQGRVLEISSSAEKMYLINFSKERAKKIISSYVEDKDFGKSYANLMKILIKYVKVR